MGSILGGSYRVRAFKAPEYAQSQTESFFLAANERKTIDFKLAAVGGDKIVTAVNPSPPRVDQPAIVSITIGVGAVDSQGRPALTPRAGVVLTMTPGPGIALESSPQARTDANGTAAWQIRCAVEGANTILLAGSPGASTQLTIPACAQPGATATTRSG